MVKVCTTIYSIFLGYIINNDWLFHRLSDHQLFEDGYFFNLSEFDDGFEEEPTAIGTPPLQIFANGKGKSDMIKR